MSGVAVGAIGLGVGLIGGIGKLIGSGSANKKLSQLIGQEPTYTANPIAAQRLALAQNLLNARMPGASYAESNIYGNQANQEANIQRNATSGSQALAMGAATQAGTNKAFTDLGAKEAEDYQRRYANLSSAEQGQIQEGDKVYQDQIRRFQDLAQIRGQQNANTQNAWSSISNAGFGVASFGLSGGIGRLFGGQAGQQQAANSGQIPLSSRYSYPVNGQYPGLYPNGY